MLTFPLHNAALDLKGKPPEELPHGLLTIPPEVRELVAAQFARFPPEAFAPGGQAVNRALARLEGDERRLLQLRHRDHLGFEEIGTQLNCSTAEARRRWVEALKRFSDALGSEP